MVFSGPQKVKNSHTESPMATEWQLPLLNNVFFSKGFGIERNFLKLAYRF